jgi:hypothetical protein
MMIPQALQHEPLYDINPRTGISFEVFYADQRLETFGRVGAGWFWWPRRRRGSSPDGSPTGPFATRYSAYRHATGAGLFGRRARPTHNVNTDTVRTRRFFKLLFGS